MSDTGFIDLLEDWQAECSKLKLMQKRLNKDTKLADVFAKQEEKVKTKERLIDEYKHTRALPYPVKAFVTLRSVKAATAIFSAFNVGYCARCCCSGTLYENR